MAKGRISQSLGRLSGEPIVHFILAACAIMLILNLFPGRHDTVDIGPEEVKALEAAWRQQAGRDPSKDELKALVDDELNTRLLYNEALRLGLDQDDEIIRRRLAQKMMFVLDDSDTLPAPDEEELRQYYSAHAEDYRLPALLSFSQIQFSGANVQDAEREARQALAKLQAGNAAPETLGQGSLLPSRVKSASPEQIAANFGEVFAKSLTALPEKKWTGPVNSTVGVHLVRIESSQPQQLPSFEAVRDRVAADLSEQRRQQHIETRLAELRKDYGQSPASSAASR